jgi:hypothetical protein
VNELRNLVEEYETGHSVLLRYNVIVREQSHRRGQGKLVGFRLSVCGRIFCSVAGWLAG